VVSLCFYFAEEAGRRSWLSMTVGASSVATVAASSLDKSHLPSLIAGIAGSVCPGASKDVALPGHEDFARATPVLFGDDTALSFNCSGRADRRMC
jgi:hypothetical protein